MHVAGDNWDVLGSSHFQLPEFPYIPEKRRWVVPIFGEMLDGAGNITPV